MNRIISFSLVVAVFGLLCVGSAVGQGGTGELTGLVTDSTGAVVANATVTLTNNSTAEKRTTVTTGAGIYRFSALPIVGTYTLELAPKGFKAIKIANIPLSVGTIVSKDVRLEVGAATELVTVESGGETVQTAESALSTLVDRNIWQNMPLQIRNQNSFIELVAGAVPQDGSGQNRGAVVNGTRGGTGSYLVEGMDNNEQGQAGRGQISFYDKGGAATSISPDAIQEYRVITNSYSAEYGKGGGFVTDAVLRSGTNQWHGSAFEYNRVQALAANDWFSTRAGWAALFLRTRCSGTAWAKSIAFARHIPPQLNKPPLSSSWTLCKPADYSSGQRAIQAAFVSWVLEALALEPSPIRRLGGQFLTRSTAIRHCLIPW